MGANLGSRHAMVAQGSPAARSPAPHGAGVTPNHHTDRLKACLEIEVGRLSTAVSRIIQTSKLYELIELGSAPGHDRIRCPNGVLCSDDVPLGHFGGTCIWTK